jgi:cation diffusion facilitator CzcD-associated flavoprotein CzcO
MIRSISYANETGLVTTDGKQHDFDIIICATGFDVSFIPRFAVLGRDGKSLQTQWSQSPQAYLSMFAPNFPNYITVLGPGAPSAQGSIIVSIERISDYVIKLIRRLQTESMKTFEVDEGVVNEYIEHMKAQIATTVWSESCSSWFKNGSSDGQVTALHPGGRLHFFALLMEPVSSVGRLY